MDGTDTRPEIRNRDRKAANRHGAHGIGEVGWRGTPAGSASENVLCPTASTRSIAAISPYIHANHAELAK